MECERRSQQHIQRRTKWRQAATRAGNSDRRCSSHRAVVWSRSDRPARMFVEYDFNPRFTNPIGVRGPFALETSDYTVRVDLTELPENSEVFVRVMFEDLSNDSIVSEAVQGYFRTAPVKTRAIRFMWGGDTAGTGWVINTDFGG